MRLKILESIKPEIKFNDFITLQPEAEISLSYKEGSPPKKYIGKPLAWAVDAYEEESGMINVNMHSGPYPGAFCSWVHEDDVIEIYRPSIRKTIWSKK